jgi:hypothetical protein
MYNESIGDYKKIDEWLIKTSILNFKNHGAAVALK